MLAALLAHEASHAEADLSGMLKADEEALGVVAACYLDEQRASLAELSVWLTVYGRGGKADPVHPYEHEINAELAAYLEDPQEYLAHLARAHAGECQVAWDEAEYKRKAEQRAVVGALWRARPPGT